MSIRARGAWWFAAFALGACGADQGTPQYLGGGGFSDGGPPSRIDAPGVRDVPGPQVMIDFPDALGGDPIGEACATQSMQAERLPLDLYFMVDSSGSMTDRTSTDTTKWEAVANAFASFFRSAGASGIGAGMQFFPQLRPGVPEECFSDAACGAHGPCNRLKSCNGGTRVMPCDVDGDCPTGQRCVLLGACRNTPFYCVGDFCQPAPGEPATSNPCETLGGYCGGRDVCEAPAYAQPTVPIGALPGVADALVGALVARNPEGLTPTGPALGGALEHARARALQNPARRVAVVLATDGFPTECNPGEIDAIAAVARAAVMGTPRVPTFVIGVFSPDEATEAQTNLSAIAMAGGTTRAQIIGTDQNVTQGFLAALNEIRTQALSCEYKIPPATMGELDYFRVNVRYTPAGVGAPQTVRYVKNRAACDPRTGGWYYDIDPATSGGTAPTTINMCDATCANLRIDTRGKVDVIVGCKTYGIE